MNPQECVGSKFWPAPWLRSCRDALASRSRTVCVRTLPDSSWPLPTPYIINADDEGARSKTQPCHIAVPPPTTATFSTVRQRGDNMHLRPRVDLSEVNPISRGHKNGVYWWRCVRYGREPFLPWHGVSVRGRVIGTLLLEWLQLAFPSLFGDC